MERKVLSMSMCDPLQRIMRDTGAGGHSAVTRRTRGPARDWRRLGVAAAVAGLFAAVLLAPACRPPDNEPNDSNGSGEPNDDNGTGNVAPPPMSGSGSADVTYKPVAQVLDATVGNAAIAGISTNGAALLLDASNPQVAALQAGSVLVIKGLLAKKVIAVEPQDPYLLVLTQPAVLSDAISDGHVTVLSPIQFGEVATAKRRRPAESADGAQKGQDAASATSDALGNVLNGITGAVVDGWTTDWSVTPTAGRINLSLHLTKSVGGFNGDITGEGYLTGFDFDSDILVQQSTYQKVESNLKSLNGVMNFSWTVTKETPGDYEESARIKLPGAIEIPLYQYLDGLPLFLEISAALIIKPALSGGQELSRGSFRINYDGTQHFTIRAGNIDANGNVTGDIQVLETQTISELAPLGMVVAFAAPRIELTFGVSKALKASGDLQQAAARVDQLADALASRVLTPEQYQQFKNSPLGEFSLENAVETSLASNAEAYFEMVTSSGFSDTGFSVITPCSRQDIILAGKVGASAQVFAQQLGEASKEIFHQQITNIDPPGTRLCEEIDTGGGTSE
jgi:hypothetical protein